MINELDFAHFDFSRSDLDRVGLTFIDSCCLHGACGSCAALNGFLSIFPWHFLLSVKLFSNLGSSLKNLGTYLLILLLVVLCLVDKGHRISLLIELHFIWLRAQTQYRGKNFLSLQRILIEDIVDCYFFFTRSVAAAYIVLLLSITKHLIFILSPVNRVKQWLAEGCIIRCIHVLIQPSASHL
jgi:hypothetical protein